MPSNQQVQPLTKAILDDIEIIDGHARLSDKKYATWLKKLAAMKDKADVFCELLAVSLQLLEAGQNHAALQFGDLSVIGIYPAVKGREMREGAAGISSAARSAVAAVTKGLKASVPGSAAFGPRPTGGAGIGLRPGPKKR